MHLTFAKSLCGLLLAAAISPLWAADFAPKDARATLSVEYVYLSNGKRGLSIQGTLELCGPINSGKQL